MKMNRYMQPFLVETFAQRITELMKRNGLTHEKFGKMIGKTKASVTGWVNCRTIPDTDAIIAIAKSFNVSIDWLFNMRPDKSKMTSSEAAMEIIELTEAMKMKMSYDDENGTVKLSFHWPAEKNLWPSYINIKEKRDADIIDDDMYQIIMSGIASQFGDARLLCDIYN